ncbi:MAG: hypothetical protein ACREBH_03015 [Candidatus Micrarchaeaceae archaeon]
MVLGLIAAIIIAFISMFIPGILLAFALLRKTELHTFEVVVIGFIFGMIAPATLTWAESYLINYIHAFTFSLGLFEVNVLVLTIIGAVLCYYQGVFGDLKVFMSSISSSTKDRGISQSLGEIRGRLGRFEKGRSIITAHDQEDNALRSKQHTELSSLSNLSSDERSKTETMHNEALERLRENHIKEESNLLRNLDSTPAPSEKRMFKTSWLVWAILLILMIITFYTRMQSIVIAPKFFEFDPYFDMVDAHYILTYGRQLLLDPSAWPVVAVGTNHRLQPLVPYLEAFWYDLANVLQYHKAAFSSTLMSYVGGIYPPITAALLVFVIFVLLYHEYDERIGLIGAGLTATMPVLFTTFIAGEQLVEPWGIFALFFFFATYMLAIRNKKDKRLAVLAGIAFASNFLGAHYYTVTMGVITVYILAEGIIEILRKESLTDFYKMNAIVLGIIILFYVLYAPYQATLQSNLSSVLGIPIVIAGPLFALILIAIFDFVPKLMAKNKVMIKEASTYFNLAFMVLIFIIAFAAILFTSVGAPIKSYINLSARFTTPSKPLFMTVQEYIPTGILYAFGAQGFGAIGAGALGVPYMVLLISAVSFILICISIYFRRSKTGVLYLAVALPLMFAGFSEVKYLPHFGVAYIMLFGIILGEFMFLANDNFKMTRKKTSADKELAFDKNVYTSHPLAAKLAIIVGLFFLFGLVFAIAAIAFILIYEYGIKQSKDKNNATLVAACVLLALFSLTSNMFLYGESASIVSSIGAQITYASNPANACTLLSNKANSLGYNTYCNTIPQYWLNAMSWINQNVGPNAPRVLAWWDYGDWINWFGNSNAVIRGDNSVAKEDYAIAAQYVLGPKPITTANGTVSVATPQTLASYMNANQTKYVLFDQDLISKWGALDFLGCVNVNKTSETYAIAQGQINSPPQPYVLGTSQCEVNHDPEFVLLPLSALVPTNQTKQSINEYCSISNSKTTYISGYLVVGDKLENNTVCIDSVPNANGVLRAYDANGTEMNAVIQSSEYTGVVDLQSSPYVEFMMIYLPNANGTITDAPSQFYESNYYDGFFLGELPGFTEVYPSNATGVNFVNGTYPIRIYSVNNYTGGLPSVPQKPSWVSNNDIMP